MDSSVMHQDRRGRRIAEVCELVIQTMNLRAPQAEALRAVAHLLLKLPRPLSECSSEELRSFLSDGGKWKHASHPSFNLSLATGVGKTRLAGAIMALLYLSRESSTFLILAPRRAVLRRFADALDPQFREYIFVDQGLVPDPYVISGDQIADPAGVEAMPDAFRSGPTIYLLSPQLVATSDRFKGKQAFSGRSPAEHLKAKKDLVVIVDEAHHVGGQGRAEAAKWTEAIRDLQPALQLGMTATPRGEEGDNVLYNYPLSKALIERLYTKDVHLLVRNFQGSLLSEEEIDRATIDYSLTRLSEKKAAIDEVQVAPFPEVKPVCVFFARDIEHAEWVAGVLHESHQLAEEEILVTHSRSSKTDEELEKLLSIEDPANKVRVVVNVQELTEGWDVRNVYVVAPLRAMATFQGAIQAMGRGLRLPAGRRIDHPEVDALDVVCFGKQGLKAIVEEATTWLGQGRGQGTAGIVVDEFDTGTRILLALQIATLRDVPPLSIHELEPAHEEVSIDVQPSALTYSAKMAIEDLELSRLKSRLASEKTLRIPREAFIRAAVFRIIRVAYQYLSDDEHAGRVRAVVEAWLVAAESEGEMVEFDPAEIGEEIGRIIVEGAKRRALSYQATGRTLEVGFGPFDVQVVRSTNDGKSVTKPTLAELPLATQGSFTPREYYRGVDGHEWSQSLHAAYSFDSFPEVQLAWLLDTAESVDWWVRNDPRRLTIETPAGGFSPDFIVALKSGELYLIEVKGGLYWTPPDSEARVKAASATRWAAMQSELLGIQVTFGVALDTDLEAVSSYDALTERLRTS